MQTDNLTQPPIPVSDSPLIALGIDCDLTNPKLSPTPVIVLSTAQQALLMQLRDMGIYTIVLARKGIILRDKMMKPIEVKEATKL